MDLSVWFLIFTASDRRKEKDQMQDAHLIYLLCWMLIVIESNLISS